MPPTQEEMEKHFAAYEANRGTCLSGVLLVVVLLLWSLLRSSPMLGACTLALASFVGWRWPNTLVLQNVERKAIYFLHDLPFFFVCPCCSGRNHDLPLKRRDYDWKLSEFVNLAKQADPGANILHLRGWFLQRLFDQGNITPDDVHPQLISNAEEWNIAVAHGVNMHQPPLKPEDWEEVDHILSTRGQLERRIDEGSFKVEDLKGVEDVYDLVKACVLSWDPNAQLAE